MLSADTMVNTAAAAVTSGTVLTRVSVVIDGSGCVVRFLN
jgi:hypothetical protein